ncbi:DEAD-box type RNA helicase, partial [Coelomomyces lativittatus]
MKYKKLHYELQVQCSLLLHHPLPLPSKIYVSRLTSLVTVLREFSALVQLPSFTLCNEILDPTLHPQPPGKDFNDLLDSHEIQKLQRHHGLTKVQAKAVLTALYQPSGFVLIQGPPGTGKTKTILSLLGLLQSNHKRVLICAPSNAAVDVLTSRGHLQGVKDIDGNVSFPSLVRVGNSESISAGIAEVSLDELIEEDLSNFILKQKVGGHAQKLSELIQEKMNCLQVMDTLKKQLHTSTDLLTIQQLEKKLHQHHLKYSQLLPTIHEYKSKLTEENQHMETMKLQTRARHLQNAKFITCTLSTSGHKSLVTSLPKDAFDIVIIDEAAQCVELSALIPLKFGVKKCIFVGDPNQLPPTVFSLHAKDYFYEKSLFVRIQENREQSVILLDTQYRMHPEI